MSIASTAMTKTTAGTGRTARLGRAVGWIRRIRGVIVRLGGGREAHRGRVGLVRQGLGAGVGRVVRLHRSGRVVGHVRHGPRSVGVPGRGRLRARGRQGVGSREVEQAGGGDHVGFRRGATIRLVRLRARAGSIGRRRRGRAPAGRELPAIRAVEWEAPPPRTGTASPEAVRAPRPVMGARRSPAAACAAPRTTDRATGRRSPGAAATNRAPPCRRGSAGP